MELPEILSDEQVFELSRSEDDGGRYAYSYEHVEKCLKAQRKEALRRFVEWGEELCYDQNGEQRREQGWRVKRRECPICYQELRKLAELEGE